jgi:hypothetical protein
LPYWTKKWMLSYVSEKPNIFKFFELICGVQFFCVDTLDLIWWSPRLQWWSTNRPHLFYNQNFSHDSRCKINYSYLNSTIFSDKMYLLIKYSFWSTFCYCAPIAFSIFLLLVFSNIITSKLFGWVSTSLFQLILIISCVVLKFKLRMWFYSNWGIKLHSYPMPKISY